MPYTTINRPGAMVPPANTAGCGCGCSTCETCDSLQCLCRPRFFAGQLVTDADFRRLDQYLVGKDRLHNKFLHGTGVVCGLEVVCNPCDDTVTVRPGYALGPCGEDIVVCADTSVDVGAMIRAQRRANARTACPPDSNPYASKPNDCDALEQQWVLGICYDEQPGRPVTSLTSTSCSAACSPSSGGCGTSAGNCGCGGGCGTSAAPAPVGCEPTVICEGFRFSLTKQKPAQVSREPVRDLGQLGDRVRQCLAMLRANITSVPQDASASELVTYCCQFKADLRTIIESGNIHDCTLGQRLSSIVCPDATDAAATEKARTAIAEMLVLAIDLYRECICSALLPPCPNDCADDCVPIATLTVRSADLHVLDVCNWSSRKFAVTMPMLGYWLGWLPFGASLRRLVSTLCCPPQQLKRFTLNDNLHVTHEMAEPVAKSDQADVAFAEPVRAAMRYAQHPSPLAGFEATLLQSVGARGSRGVELASPDELNDPFTAVAMSRLFGPAGLNLGAVFRDVASLSTPASSASAAEPAPAAQQDQTDRLAELEKAVESLQRTVRSQARTISNMRKGQQK